MPATWSVALLLLLVSQEKAEVGVESLKLDPAALKAMDQVELKVMEGGKAAVYRGVPLASVLTGKPGEKLAMADLRALADAVLLVRAEDDYQASVSAVAAAMDPDGERYLLALTKDGEPLGQGQGPVKLVIPGDPRHVRWVRRVKAVDLVRLPRPSLKASKPRDR